MYGEWGGAPSAGVVTGIGTVAGRRVMIIANDATVKAGAFFPMTCKKVLRAQRIALENRLPLVYLVDCAGVFLPLQDEVFPDEDDFGRIFRNNAVISAAGIPQFAAIMGNCVAGGGYLPVLCDKLLMTEGSGLYLAGPALVKAAIGQTVSHEELGGAAMHAAVSGTIDFREPDDADLPGAAAAAGRRAARRRPRASTRQSPPGTPGATSYQLFPPSRGRSTTSATCCRASSTRARSTSTRRSTARRSSAATAGSAAWRSASSPTSGSAASRPTGRCSSAASSTSTAPTRPPASSWTAIRRGMPILFLQDVNGFMVGRDSEQAGIIRAGAKLVNVIANSVVPKITVILGGSFGAGNYALCGKAFDPRFIFAWPTARYAVMGGEQAASTLLDITVQRPEARRPRAGRGRAGGAAPQGARRATRSRPTSATPRPGCGWTRSSSRRRRARRCCWRWRWRRGTTTAGRSRRACCKSRRASRRQPDVFDRIAPRDTSG